MKRRSAILRGICPVPMVKTGPKIEVFKITTTVRVAADGGGVWHIENRFNVSGMVGRETCCGLTIGEILEVRDGKPRLHSPMCQTCYHAWLQPP